MVTSRAQPPSRPRSLLERALLDPARAAITLGRAGLADPLLGAAYAAAVARWGPSVAAAYTAAARRHPARPAIIDDDGPFTYAELDRFTDRVAGGLPGERTVGAVGILCRNHRGFVIATVAAAKAGRGTVYLNTGFAAPQLAEVIGREHASVVVHDDEFADIVSTAASK